MCPENFHDKPGCAQWSGGRRQDPCTRRCSRHSDNMGSLLQRIFIPFKCSHEHCIKSFMIGICRAHRLPWACGAGTLQTSRATWMHTNWENETCNNNRAIGFSMKKNQSNRYYRISQLQKIIKSVLLKVSYWSGNTRHSLSRVVHGWDHHFNFTKIRETGIFSPALSGSMDLVGLGMPSNSSHETPEK